MEKSDVARICHEANRAYCIGIGDPSQESWDESPDWQKESAIKGVDFHLTILQAGKKPNPAHSHVSWLADKEQKGWKYGLVKDESKKEHPCFVLYDKLSAEQKAKDYIFCGIVEAVFNSGLI